MADTALDVLHGRADWAIDVGDTRTWLRSLPSNSAHMVLTSPPYWALRDYGTAAWKGGDAGCDHKQPGQKQGATSQRAGRANVDAQRQSYKGVCGKCGAVRVDAQIGAEEIPDCGCWLTRAPACGQCYVCHMVEVFREVRRVLRNDGILWLNLGSSYATGKIGQDIGKNGVGQVGAVADADDGETLLLRDDLTPDQVVYVLTQLAAHQVNSGEVG